jgi:hypothetical protein
MMDFSSISDSKAIEQIGSMIISKNTICKGNNKRGINVNMAGNKVNPMIGI